MVMTRAPVLPIRPVGRIMPGIIIEMMNHHGTGAGMAIGRRQPGGSLTTLSIPFVEKLIDKLPLMFSQPSPIRIER